VIFAGAAEQRSDRRLIEGNREQQSPNRQIGELVSERISATSSFSSEAYGAWTAVMRG